MDMSREVRPGHTRYHASRTCCYNAPHAVTMRDLWPVDPRPEHTSAVDVWGSEEVVVVRPKPRVEQEVLTLWDGDGQQQIVVGSPEWFQWIETATVFTFASAQGTFTARR